MNLNPVKVNNFNKLPGAKNNGWLVAGILASSLLTACGGGGGLSAGEKAAQDAAAAQAAAAQAAATAAAQAAAAQAAAERETALAAARLEVDDAITEIDKYIRAAQSNNSSAGWLALQAEQQAVSYPEVADSLAKTKEYAAQVAQEVDNLNAQKALATQAKTDAENSQDLTLVQKAAQSATSAVASAKVAWSAADQAFRATQAAAKQVSEEVAAANAARRYTKLDSAGNALPASATSWACVKENATGKVWESKTNDNGLRDRDWRYRHLHNSAGYEDTKDYNGLTLCQGIGNCDAYSYVNAVNNSGGLCGRSRWRLPTMEELLDLVQLNDNGQRPNIDLKFFPDTVNKPNEAAYCSENLARTATDCGYPAGTPVNQGADGRIECNYQGVDYGLPISANNLRGGSMVPLRYYGEVQDGKPLWPNANWVCYTRLISSY